MAVEKPLLITSLTQEEEEEEEVVDEPSSSPVFQSSYKALSTTTAGSQRSEGDAPLPSSQLSAFSIDSDSFKFTPKSSLEFGSSSSQSLSQARLI